MKKYNINPIRVYNFIAAIVIAVLFYYVYVIVEVDYGCDGYMSMSHTIYQTIKYEIIKKNDLDFVRWFFFILQALGILAHMLLVIYLFLISIFQKRKMIVLFILIFLSSIFEFFIFISGFSNDLISYKIISAILFIIIFVSLYLNLNKDVMKMNKRFNYIINKNKLLNTVSVFLIIIFSYISIFIIEFEFDKFMSPMSYFNAYSDLINDHTYNLGGFIMSTILLFSLIFLPVFLLIFNCLKKKTNKKVSYLFIMLNFTLTTFSILFLFLLLVQGLIAIFIPYIILSIILIVIIIVQFIINYNWHRYIVIDCENH